MSQLPEEKALELKRLERIATEKRIAYERLDIKVRKAGAVCDKADLLIGCHDAKIEFLEAVSDYYVYKKELERIYHCNSKI